jgi:hypothetical protein
MAATPQSQAIEVANGLMSCAQQLMNTYKQLKTLSAEWTDDQVANYLAQLKTAPVQPDGSLGPPDANPVHSNPIVQADYPALSRAVSSLQIEQVKSILDGVSGYIDGQAVTTQPGARAILNAVVGG